MADTISWIATAATILAACMTASNLGARITGSGFIVFTIGSLSWLALGLLIHQPALIWTNIALTGLNLFGVWRWLGHQARVEKGARSAVEASEQSPGETLFPISLLCHGPVVSAAEPVGSCVDAMAGNRSGRLAYLIVSQGGVAGVGETLRKVPWTEARVEGEAVAVDVSPTQFEGFEEVPRDRWPAR